LKRRKSMGRNRSEEEERRSEEYCKGRRGRRVREGR
jgi:hypothetical protein